jgi:CMP-N-acetylneuraminic acid synthetase
MKINVIIPARGGSKRLLNKNIHPVWGKPMIYWAIKSALNLNKWHETKVWVSSDSLEILDVAKEFGANTILRSKNLSGDLVFKQAAIRNAALDISKTDPSDLWVSLQANSPEISEVHLKQAIDVLVENERDEIFSVDSNFMQNAAFRIFKGGYVFQEDLSTNCGVIVCDIQDVHTIDDIKFIESKPSTRIINWS